MIGIPIVQLIRTMLCGMTALIKAILIHVPKDGEWPPMEHGTILLEQMIYYNP